MKLTKYILSLALAASGVAALTSCDDMLDKGNSFVIYADKDHLTSASDTVTSLTGILYKVQAIAVRTNLLGEVRGDLVNVNENAILDLKDLANFEADVTGDDDKNMYNNPRDYFAVINNCNYYLKNVNDSLPEIHTPGMNYMFEREVAVVRGVRAWTYLQCVLAYGKVPFIDEPVLSEAASNADYPMYEIEDICDYFIKDLTPYKDIEMPGFTRFGSNFISDPKTCFFPINLVLGDLYLWKAAKTQDKEAAKSAAKCYYDFIESHDINGKRRTTTGTSSIEWSATNLYKKEYKSVGGSMSYTTDNFTWGRNNEYITVIAMDSSSVKGYYNELRNLYNGTQDLELKEASISPSDYLKELSAAQVYVGYDQERELTKVEESDLDDEALEDYLLGDLRFQSNYSTRDVEYNMKEIEMQTINKHRGMNVGVYRIQQIYLRLAEALNYAGYPRFAKQILTMGVNNDVIETQVQPYYTSAEDSAFIKYFDLNPTFYINAVDRYVPVNDAYGNVSSYTIIERSSMGGNTMNMLGIHSRGSGLSYMNEEYLPEIAVDSTYAPFPQEALDTIGEKPNVNDYAALFPKKPSAPQSVKKPSTWDLYPGEVVTKEQYKEIWSSLTDKQLDTRYENYIKVNAKDGLDSVGRYSEYLKVYALYEEDMVQYSADTALIMDDYRKVLSAYEHRVEVFNGLWNEWHNAIYSNPAYVEAEQDQVAQAILDEQALELSYEGNRYYDLMRNAFWYNDPSRLANAVATRDPRFASLLLDKKKWFLNYKNKIGFTK